MLFHDVKLRLLNWESVEITLLLQPGSSDL